MVAEANSAAIVVLLTAGSQEEASRLAEMLVGAHLAACVQILPQMESVYRWKGEVHRAPEFLLLAKTTAACFDELEREVRALHTYDTP
ncbi:MAG: divalent-cation tolerance protein CutA [Acidobacteria bacterium]|nr:MAG: divalent-cation tolerance protein CutA [Acidobacteriota bacterium]